MAEPTKDRLRALEHKFGLKGAAMVLFSHLNWFPEPIVFLKPHGSIEEASANVRSELPGGGPFTVRFSHRRELGLPRRFCRTQVDVSRVLKSEWRKEWMAIIHPYIDVRDSFEIHVEQGRVVVEHVPGVWESDSRLPPDLLLGPDNPEALRYMQVRRARGIGTDGEYNYDAQIVSDSQLRSWWGDVRGRLAELRALAGTEPLNVHCVTDDKGRFWFLNARLTGSYREPEFGMPNVSVIDSEKDIDAWDGRSPVLLRISVNRGEEANFARIARRLRDAEFVYVEFGGLSHPAIVLRENGVNPIPIFASHEKVSLRDEVIA